jgi:hypothetical protein
MELRRPRQWGACWLACHLYEQLQLDQFWADRLVDSREGTCWRHILQTLVCYRLIDPGSEWRLHRLWFEKSAMGDLLGEDYSLVEKNALYRCLDKVLEHKSALFGHLRERWQDLFQAKFDVLLYDLTSTYFESDPPNDPKDKRRYGYSRDKRSDCVQVVIALIVTPEGFPLAYEVLPGNTSDKTTLRRFLHKIETQYGKAERIWVVMDRGIPTEAVLAEMRQSDPPVYYLVGTPKGRLTQLEQQLLSLPWQASRGGGEAFSSGARIVRAGSESGSDPQRTRHAPPPTARVSQTAKRTAADEIEQHAKTVAQTGRRQGTVSGRLAADRYRDARVLGFKLLVSAQSAKASSGAPARRTLFTAQQYLRQRTG